MQKNKPYYLRNTGKDWSSKEIRELKNLAAINTPTRVIGFKLGRPVGGVEAKAQERDISLKPINRSPYSRKK